MNYIELTQGKYTIVDDEDLKEVSKYKWYFSNGYARRDAGYGINRERIKMHRFILNIPKNVQVDHKNGDTLDNRRENLRICTKAENLRNRKIGKNNTSGYKGVDWFKNRNLWRAKIKYNNKLIHLGYFQTKIDAAKAYNNAAIKYHKEFSRLNKI